MNLATVAAEMRTALLTVPGLRVPVWGDDAVAGGGGVALVGVPDELEPTTYGRGKLRAPDWPVFLLVPGQDRSAHAKLAQLLGEGAPSAWVALEAGTYTACDFVHVARVEIDTAARYRGSPVLAAVLHTDVNGTGK